MKKKHENKLKFIIAKLFLGFDESKEVPNPIYSYQREKADLTKINEFNEVFSSIHHQLKEKYSSSK